MLNNESILDNICFYTKIALKYQCKTIFLMKEGAGHMKCSPGRNCGEERGAGLCVTVGAGGVVSASWHRPLRVAGLKLPVSRPTIAKKSGM